MERILEVQKNMEDGVPIKGEGNAIAHFFNPLINLQLIMISVGLCHHGDDISMLWLGNNVNGIIV